MKVNVASSSGEKLGQLTCAASLQPLFSGRFPVVSDANFFQQTHDGNGDSVQLLPLHISRHLQRRTEVCHSSIKNQFCPIFLLGFACQKFSDTFRRVLPCAGVFHSTGTETTPQTVV